MTTGTSHPTTQVLYGEDLAFVQASGFSEFASAAMTALLPLLLARGVRRVIDVGCGAGVSTRALLDAGFETIAIEPSPALLAIAGRVAVGAELRQASAYEAELVDCDAILAIGEPLTYHAPEDDAEQRIRSFFAKAGRALRVGGQLVFDLIETGEPALDARNWTSGPDWVVLYETREQGSTRYLTRRIETFRKTSDGSYRRGGELHHVRLFDRSAVTSWLERAGFDVQTATAYGRFELPPRRVAFVASRRAD